MFIISLIFLIATILTIINYFRTINHSERFNFTNLSSLLQTVFVYFALWISIYTFLSSNSDTQELFNNLREFNNQFSQMEVHLNDVSTKLKEMPRQIENFASSIDSLNNGIDQQKKDFQVNTKELNKTIKDLSYSVTDYEQNINNYSQQLKSVVDLTDKQLIIWEKQQKVLLDEFSRKPALKLEIKEKKFNDNSFEIVDLEINNEGNIEANIRAIFFWIPIKGLIGIDSTVFGFYKDMNNCSYYRMIPADTNLEIIAANSGMIIPCIINISNEFKDQIEYRIDYFSKYSSGNQTGKLIIKDP